MPNVTLGPGIEVSVPDPVPGASEILSSEAVTFVAELHRALNPERLARLAARQARQVRLDAGERLDFLPETAEIRAGSWHVAETPQDLMRRWAEITGPVDDRKMIVTALNSGADVFLADLEDSLSPTWANVVQAQLNLRDAVRRTMSVDVPGGGTYRIAETTATLIVRPRGWHLDEPHVQIDGAPVSASLFDFGMYMFQNARELIARGSGPYFYLPKLETHLEARLWNEAFNLAQAALDIPRGTIRATAYIETLPAAFEMDEILYELRDHAAGLNAGRWDYVFSVIKRMHMRADAILPDRAMITMDVPFMRAFTDLLVRTAHRRGAHAIGGMAAYFPSRRTPDAPGRTVRPVYDDKLQESTLGFDGTSVGHPDLVPTARRVFEEALSGLPHQRHRSPHGSVPTAAALTDFAIPGGAVTAQGVRDDISVALQYLNAWLGGAGVVAINNVMEGVATAEIARAQLWQWRHFAVPVDGGAPFIAAEYERIRDEELKRLTESGAFHYAQAARLLDQLVLSDQLEEFLTIPAYQELA